MYQIPTKIMEERQYVKVETIDGDFLCVQSFDCSEGDLIDVYDTANHYIGYIHGNLEYFTEDELIENIEDMIDDEDGFYNDVDDEVSDDDVGNGQWNFD